MNVIANKLVFICIGTNKIMGDCLGPIVGTYLKSKFKDRLYEDIEVYGDIYNPIDYNSIHSILNLLEPKNEKCTRILVDSALGENVGDIVINSGGINIGEGILNGKQIVADINIKGIVGKNYKSIKKNMNQLGKINFNQINQMANYIVRAIEV